MQILGTADKTIRKKYADYKKEIKEMVVGVAEKVESMGYQEYLHKKG